MGVSVRKTFAQLGESCVNGHIPTDFEYRTVLQWFRCPSLYFPSDRDKKQALDAFIWLYQKVSGLGGVPLSPEARRECAIQFAAAFSLTEETAERLTSGFLDRFDGRRPVMIGVEGLDGSGKTVQAHQLCAALRQRGKRVLIIDFPQYESFFGREIGELLAGKSKVTAMELDEKSMCLWYALDRWKAVSGLEMEQHEYVIFNRYTLSNVVYQSARKYHGLDRKFADWIFELEHIQLGLPIPDIYLYLDAKTGFCQDNVLKKDRQYVDGLDVYEGSEDLLLCCGELYRDLHREIGEVSVLECLDESGALKSVEEIGAMVLQCLRDRGLYA